MFFRGDRDVMEGRKRTRWPLWLMVPLWLGLAVMVMAVAGGIVLFPPLLVAVFGGVLCVALLFLNPLVGFGIVASLRLFETVLLFVPAEGGPNSLLSTLSVGDVLFLVLAAALALRVCLLKDGETLRVACCYGLFFLLCGFLFVLFVPGLIHVRSSIKGLAYILRTVDPMAGAAMALLLIRRREDLYLVARIMLPALVITALWGWYEAFTGTYILEQMGREISEAATSSAAAGSFRAIGPEGDAVYYSVMLVFGMAMSLVVVEHARSGLMRVYGILTLLLCGATVLPTGSRAGLLAVFLLMGVYFVFARIRGKRAFLLVVLLLSGTGVTIYSVTISAASVGRLVSMGGEQDKSTEHRLGFYSQCLRMAGDSPLVGVGHGHFSSLQVRYFDRRTPRAPYFPHSAYLQVLAEDGFFALVVYLSIYAACGLPLLSAALKLRTAPDRNVAGIMLGLLLAMAFCATNTNMLENQWKWFSFALALIVARVYDDPSPDVTIAAVDLRIPGLKEIS